MALLIDGYNLLHVTGIVGHGKELTELHRSREALLRFLAQSIDAPQRSHTTIVFDAAGAPPGLPQTLIYEAMTVYFARDYADADAMIEELIAADHTPRSLTVVSSDHRIQRAARRRRAKAIDSNRWYGELWATRHRRGHPTIEQPQKPGAELSAGEVSYWLKEFAEPANDQNVRTLDGGATKQREPINDDMANPFPPGYAEDLDDAD